MVVLAMMVWTIDAHGRDVLLLGNSYTASNRLPEVVQDGLRARPPWPTAEVSALTAPGWTLAQHLEAADGTAGDTPWTEALAQPWDVVVLQEQSQTLGFDRTVDPWLTSRDSAVALAELARAAGARPALHLTWGRRDGDSTNPDLYPDFSTMQDRLTTGALEVAVAMGDADGPATVVPTGEVFRSVHDAAVDAGEDPLGSTLFRRLYQADGSHPSPLGTWVSAATHHAALLGRDPDEVPAPWPEVDPRDIADLAEHVRAVVFEAPFGDFAYPWAHPWEAGDAPWTSIGSAGERPVVRRVGYDDGGVVLDTIVIGGLDGEHPADGELRLPEEGNLAAERIELGVEGTGVLELSGGSVDVDTLVIGDGGIFRFTDGGFRARRVEGDLVQEGGSFIAHDGPTISGDLTVVAGDVHLRQPTVVVEGSATIAGLVDVGDVEPRTVLRASSLDVSRASIHGLDTLDLELQIVDEGDTVAWELVATAAPEADPGDDGAASCGCRTVTSWAAWGWLVPAGLLTARRRRPRSRSRPPAGPGAAPPGRRRAPPARSGGG